MPATARPWPQAVTSLGWSPSRPADHGLHARLRRAASLVFEAYSGPSTSPGGGGPEATPSRTARSTSGAGGAWRFVLRSPSGICTPSRACTGRSRLPERLVFTFIYDVDGIRNDEAVETIVFDECAWTDDGDEHGRPQSVEARDAHLRSGMEAGASETMDRLAQILPEMDRETVVSRVRRASRAALAGLDRPQAHRQLVGAKGFSTTIEAMDVRPGGVWTQVMRGPDRALYRTRYLFGDRRARTHRLLPERGRKGGPGAHFEAIWTFEALEAGKTRATSRMVFPTAAERDRVVGEFGVIEGGLQTLERYEDYVVSGSGPERVDCAECRST